MLIGGIPMAIKMLVFDYRENEKEFFRKKELENFDITFFEESLNDETIKEIPEDILDNGAVISVFVNSEVTENVINSFKNLRIISTRSTGVEHINLRAAEEKNIAVVNVEAYGAKSVAQFTFGLILNLIRHINSACDYMKSSKRPCINFTGRDISELTLGVVGTGSIGASVCKIAKAFGMKIIAYDVMEKQELVNNYGINYVNFNTLLRESDIITLHVPYTGENLNMFSAEQFSIMKNTSYLINTSRGELVSTKDLYNAVSKGIIEGAAIDVVVCEDLSFKCSDLSKNLNNSLDCIEEANIVKELAAMPNVIVTPHIAYDTLDAINYILEITFIAISDIIKGGNSYRVY